MPGTSSRRAASHKRSGGTAGLLPSGSPRTARPSARSSSVASQSPRSSSSAAISSRPYRTAY